MTPEDIEAWLRTAALPFWDAKGRHPSGGFYERLTYDGVAMPEVPRRVLVQGRQMYVYADAARRGFYPRGAEIARSCADAIMEQFWQADGALGCVHALDETGAVTDARRESYDHAFVLFGFGALLHVADEPKYRTFLTDVRDFVDGTLAADLGGVYENPDHTLPRRQNPHMHLFEAYLALYDATQNADYLTRASGLFDLFRTQFFDAEHGWLLEYFDADLSPVTGDTQRVEPGHMMEWVWLLRQFERASGIDVSDYADRLFENGMRLGLDTDAFVLIDELDGFKTVTKSTRRCWPQTEFVKAAFAQYSVYHDKGLLQIGNQAVDAIFKSYLAVGGDALPPASAGGWRDQFDESGTCVVDYMPTSTFYHLYCAFVFALDQLRPSG